MSSFAKTATCLLPITNNERVNKASKVCKKVASSQFAGIQQAIKRHKKQVKGHHKQKQSKSTTAVEAAAATATNNNNATQEAQTQEAKTQEATTQ